MSVTNSHRPPFPNKSGDGRTWLIQVIRWHWTADSPMTIRQPLVASEYTMFWSGMSTSIAQVPTTGTAAMGTCGLLSSRMYFGIFSLLEVESEAQLRGICRESRARPYARSSYLAQGYRIRFPGARRRLKPGGHSLFDLLKQSRGKHTVAVFSGRSHEGHPRHDSGLSRRELCLVDSRARSPLSGRPDGGCLAGR